MDSDNGQNYFKNRAEKDCDTKAKLPDILCVDVLSSGTVLKLTVEVVKTPVLNLPVELVKMPVSNLPVELVKMPVSYLPVELVEMEENSSTSAPCWSCEGDCDIKAKLPAQKSDNLLSSPTKVSQEDQEAKNCQNKEGDIKVKLPETKLPDKLLSSPTEVSQEDQEAKTYQNTTSEGDCGTKEKLPALKTDNLLSRPTKIPQKKLKAKNPSPKSQKKKL